MRFPASPSQIPIFTQQGCCLTKLVCRDFTNTSLQDWWVDNFFMGKNGAGSGNKWVDGCFSDVSRPTHII